MTGGIELFFKLKTERLGLSGISGKVEVDFPVIFRLNPFVHTAAPGFPHPKDRHIRDDRDLPG